MEIKSKGETQMRNDNEFIKTTRLSGLLLVVAFAFAGKAVAQTEHYPITAWTSLLGPSAASTWFGPEGDRVVFDTFGKLNQTFNLDLGTEVDGNVTVRYLGDGMQQVVIHVRTTNGLCWGFNANNQPAIGFRPIDVLNGIGSAAVGRSTWRITQLPQPVGPIRSWGVESIIGNVNCYGLLRAGSGYPEGTPGFGQTTQTGLGMTGVPDGCPPEQNANCFPAEKLQFKATGN